MSTFQTRSDVPLPPAPVVSERDRALRLLRELREEEQRSDIAAPSHNGILLPKHDDDVSGGGGGSSWTTKLGGATAGALRAGAALADHHQLSADLPAVRGAEPRPPASGAASSARSSITVVPSAAGSRSQRHNHAGNGSQAGRARSVPALPARQQRPNPAGAPSTARRGEATQGRVQFDPLVALRECIKALLAKPHKYGSVHGVLESEYQYVVQLYTDAASTGDPGVSRTDGAPGKGKARTITGPSGKSVSVKENWFDVQMRQGAEGATHHGDHGETESNDGLTPGVSTLAREITSLRRLLSTAEATRDHYKTMLDRSNQDLRQRDEAIGELEKHVDSAERTELDLKRQNSNLLQELHRLKAELLSLEESRKRDNNLKRRLESQAERRLVEAKTEIGGLYTQLKVINHRYQILEREMGMTADDRDNFETRFLHATKEADDAYDAVNSRDDRITGLIGDVDSLSKRYMRLEHAVRDVMLFLGRTTIHQLLTNPLEGDIEATVVEMIDTAAASSSPPGVAGSADAASSVRLQSPARSMMVRSGFSPRTKELSNAFDDASAEEERRVHVEGVKRAAAKLLRVARSPGDDTAKLLLISAPTIWRYVGEESTARRRSLCAPHPAVTAACFLYTLRAVGGRTVLATDQTMRSLQAAVTGATSAEGKVSALRPLDDSKQLARASGEFWLAALQSITALVMSAAANQQRALSSYRDAVERKQRAAEKGAVRRGSESAAAAASASLSSSDEDSDEATPEGETIVPANAWRVIVPVSFGPSTFAAAPPASVVLLDADNVVNPPIPATAPRPATTSTLKLAHPGGPLHVSDLITPPPTDGNGVVSGSPGQLPGASLTPQLTPQAAALTPGVEPIGSASLEAQPPKTATPPTSAPRPKMTSGANTQAFVSRNDPDPAAWRWAHVAKAALLKKRVTLDDTLRVCTAEALYPQVQASPDPMVAKPFSGLALGHQVAEQRMKNARLSPAEISRFITSLLSQRYTQHVELEAHAVAHGLRRGGGGPLQGFLVGSPLQASTMQKSTEGGPTIRTPSAAASGDDEPLLPFTAGLEPFNTFVRRFAARRGTPASRHQPVSITKAGKDGGLTGTFKVPDTFAASAKADPSQQQQDGADPDLLDAADAVALDAKVFLGVSEDTTMVSMRPPAPANPMGGRAPPPEEPPVATGDAVPLPMAGVELLATVWQQSTELGGGTSGAPLDMDAHLFQLLGRGLIPEQLFVDVFFNLDLLYATCLEAANHQHLDAAKPEADAAILDVTAAVDLPVFTGILTQQGFLVTTTRPAHISAHGGSVETRNKDTKQPAAPPPLPHRRRLPFTPLELVRLVAAIARDHGATMTSVSVDQIMTRPTSASADVAAGASSSPRSAFYAEFVAVLLERFERDRRSFVEDVLLHADCIPDGTGQGRAMTPLPGDASPGVTPERTPAAAAATTAADWSKVADRKLAVPQVKSRWCDRDPALTPQDIEQLLFALTRPTKKDGFSATSQAASADADGAKDAECAERLAACGYAKHEIDAAMATRSAVYNAEVALRKKNAGFGGKKKKAKADGPDPKGPSQLVGKPLAEVVARTWPCARAAPATPLATLHAQRHDEWFDILLVDVAAKPAELAITAEHATQQYAPPKLSALAGPGAVGASPASVRRASVAALSTAASPAPLGARRSSSFHGNFAMESSVEVMPAPCRWQRVMPVDVMDAYHRFDAACQRIATFVPPKKGGAAASPNVQGSPRAPSLAASPNTEAIVLMQPVGASDGTPATKLIPHAKIRGAALPPPPTGAHYDEFTYYLTPRVANLHTVLHRTAKLYAGVFVFDTPAGVTNADDEAASGAATIEDVIAEAKRLAEMAFRTGRVPGAAAPPAASKTPASAKAAKNSGSPQAQRQESKENVGPAGELANPAEEAALASMRRAAMFSARRVVANAPSLESAFADLLTTASSVGGGDHGESPVTQTGAPPTLQLTKPQRRRSTSRRPSATPATDGSPEGGKSTRGEAAASMSAAASHFAAAFFKPDGAAKYGVESRPDFRPLLDAADVTALAGMQRGVCLSSYVSAAPDQWRAYALRKVVERGTVSASLAPHASILQLLGTLNVIGAGRDRRRSTRAGGKNKGSTTAVQALFKAAEARIDLPDPHAHVSLPMTSQLMLRAEYVVQAAPLLASPAPAVEAVMALARIRRSSDEQFPSAHRAYAAAVGGAAGGAGSNADSGGSGIGHSGVFKGTLPKDWLSQP